jgi:UDP-glucose 4-epimerase
MTNPTVVITGGCGYIGSHTILEFLRKYGDRITLISIDNYSNSSPDVIAQIKTITGKSFLNYNINIEDPKALYNCLSQHSNITGVIHFAALKSIPESFVSPEHYYSNNVNGLLNIINVCEALSIQNIIFSSSCSIYGNITQLPVDESSSPGVPQSPYAHTKKIGEEILSLLCPVKKINGISLRYFNPVGADSSGLIGEKPSKTPETLLPIIAETAAGIREKMYIFGNDYPTRDGTCIRDYIHVSDIANAHILALEYLEHSTEKGIHETFNLGSDKGISVQEMIDSFERSNAQKVPYQIAPRRQGDIVEIYSNSAKAHTLLHWHPKYDLDTIMKSAWLWQKKLLSND